MPLDAALLVSVLIPARDAAPTIGAALRSVRAQTLPRWEAVVVDDGSSDGTAEVVRSMAAVDPRIRLLPRPGRGIVAALNDGLDACRAPLVARFDADDLMHKHRLERQVALLRSRPDVSGVSSWVRCFPRRTMRAGMSLYEQWQNSLLEPDAITHERFVESPLVHPSVTVRRDVLTDAGGWHDTAWPEDWDLWLRLIETGHRFAKVPRVLHFWREGASRLTRNEGRYAAERLTEIRAHYLARGPLRGRRAVIWGAGPVGKTLSRALDAEGAQVEAFIDVDPRKIGQRVHGKPVLDYSAIRQIRPAMLLAAVGSAKARQQIREAAVSAGFVEGSDFLACA